MICKNWKNWKNRKNRKEVIVINTINTINTSTPKIHTDIISSLSLSTHQQEVDHLLQLHREMEKIDRETEIQLQKQTTGSILDVLG